MFANREEIKKLLIKNRYFVSVSGLSNEPNSVHAKFPARKRKPFFDECLYEYSWSINDKKTPEAVVDCDINKEKYGSIPCHKYAIKEIIFSSILGHCKKINYQESLIGFYLDGDPLAVEDFSTKCLSIDMTDEEKDKMNTLTIFAAVSRLDDFETLGEYEDEEYDEGIVESLSKIEQIYFEHSTINL